MTAYETEMPSRHLRLVPDIEMLEREQALTFQLERALDSDDIALSESAEKAMLEFIRRHKLIS